MSEKLHSHLFHFGILFLAGLVFVAGVVMIYPSWAQRSSLKRQESELIDRIEQKKAEIARLKEYQNRFRTDPDFVESIARKNRRVYPGEYVFIFED